MKGCSDMARFEDERGRSSQTYWGEPQGNGHRGRPAAQGQFGSPSEYGGWGRGESQGEYGGQGYGATGEFTGRGYAGPSYGWRYPEGPGYGQQGFGWQEGPAGGYGFSQRSGWQQPFAGQDIGEIGPGSYGEWREPRRSGYGQPGGMMREAYGAQLPAGFGRSQRAEMGRGFAGPEWGGRIGPGMSWGQPGEWGMYPGEERFPEPGRYGVWEDPFEGEGYGAMTRERMGAIGTFPETMTRGPHFGRGPRGYQRSDSRIEEDVNERLTRHPMLDASDIEVRITGGEVTLSGMVDSRRAKRLAEDILDTVYGVKDVNNQLRVRQERMEQGETAATTGTARGQSRSQAPRGEPAKAAAGRSQAG
jgi:hypothetical protein